MSYFAAGQAAGGINDILPVAEIMRRLISETEAALSRAPNFSQQAPQHMRATAAGM